MYESTATFAEARLWVRYLTVFTVRELADAMRVSDEVAARFCKALVYHNAIRKVGEEVYEWVSFVSPADPRSRPKRTPEWRSTFGVYDLAPPNRGMPVRLIDTVKRRQQMQGTGGARVRLKVKEDRYERQMRIQEQRRLQQKEKLRKMYEGDARERAKLKVKIKKKSPRQPKIAA
jgi:hypothetical protein